MTDAPTATTPPERSLPSTVVRGGFGGVLMGLANLVPGISGGTMLLAAGVYQDFIDGIAELTLLKFRPRSLVLLASIVVAELLAILLFAGVIKDLVVEQRWIMYSLFIGLTLGGVPLVWRMAKPATSSMWAGLVAGIALMVGVATLGLADPGSQPGMGILAVGGLVGAAAMILPGISGSYMLLVMGLYVPILDAVHALKEGLSARDVSAILAPMDVVIPVGVGVVVGVVGLSNLLKWLLTHKPQPTLGFLLGLLLGSVLGLYPFQEPVEPALGSLVKGMVVTAETLASIDVDDWPLARFAPSMVQIAASAALAAAGYGVTWLIVKWGGGEGT